MIKIAIATNSVVELQVLKDLLAKHYAYKIEDEDLKQELYTCVLTIAVTRRMQVIEVLKLLEAASGVDLLKKVKSQRKDIVFARRAASYLLRYRFSLTAEAIAKLLGYKTHVSAYTLYKRMYATDVGPAVPLELAIRRVLDPKNHMKGSRGRKPSIKTERRQDDSGS